MTYDEIKAAISGGWYIHCKTKEETCSATNMLLELGFGHGLSGYSKRYAEGDIPDEPFGISGCSSWYANPRIFNGMIEYDAKERPEKQIEYFEFEDYYNYKMGKFPEDEAEICCNMKQLFALL